MFTSIVVPCDGSALAARALPYAVRVAESGAQIHLVGVIEPMHALLGYDRAEQPEQEKRLRHLLSRELNAVAAPLQSRGFRVTTHIRIGDPAEEILAHAEKQHADLIVMTTHGRTSYVRWAMGSVANRVLQHAPMPTLIVRPDVTDEELQGAAISSIVLPLDGSALAAQAVPVAVVLAQRLAVPVEVVRVCDGHWAGNVYSAYAEMYAYMEWEKTIAEMQGDARRYVDGVTEELGAQGVVATGNVLTGLTERELVAFLDQRSQALTVMTTHGRTGVKRWLLGSVAEKLVTTSRTPTLLLRPEPSPAEQAAQTDAHHAITVV